MRTKELKGDEWTSKSTATAIAYTVCASGGCSTMLFYRCFQWRCQCHCDKKIKACDWHNVLVVQIETIKSPPARSASGIITRWCGVFLFVRGGGCLSCRSLFVIVFVVTYCCRRVRQVHLRHNDNVSFFAGVRCHCLPAMSATLRSLSTVHSQQQECTPDRQECTVDSEASEACRHSRWIMYRSLGWV